MIADRIGPAVARPYWDEYLVALHAAEAQDSTDPKRALADVVTQERSIACLENVVRWQPDARWGPSETSRNSPSAVRHPAE